MSRNIHRLCCAAGYARVASTPELRTEGRDLPAQKQLCGGGQCGLAAPLRLCRAEQPLQATLVRFKANVGALCHAVACLPLSASASHWQACAMGRTTRRWRTARAEHRARQRAAGACGPACVRACAEQDRQRRCQCQCAGQRWRRRGRRRVRQRALECGSSCGAALTGRGVS